jgi:hypothetical protein
VITVPCTLSRILVLVTTVLYLDLDLVPGSVVECNSVVVTLDSSSMGS